MVTVIEGGRADGTDLVIPARKPVGIEIRLPARPLGWRQVKHYAEEMLKMASLCKKTGCPAVVLTEVKRG